MLMNTACAQDITLPTPCMAGEKSLSMTETLAKRHSVRDYSTRTLNSQEISNLCWAACGVSRDNEHRTAPTAMNRKEIRLFVFTADGTYEYIAEKNLLQLKATGDHRPLVSGGQDFVKSAPLSLVMVIDFEKFGAQDQRAMMMGCVDAGNVSENVNLYCQSVGMVTVPRATMDINGIRQLLRLSDKQLPIMNNPVGFPKE